MALALASAAVYGLLGLSFDARGGRGDVALFLLLYAFLFALYLAAYRLGREAALGQRGSTLALVLGAAVVFRLLLLPAGLPRPVDPADARADLLGEGVVFDRFVLYDQDLWRYFWDGAVATGGHDPYRLAPSGWEEAAAEGDPAAEALLADPVREEILARVAFPSYRTVYPPLAQALFALVAWLAPGSVLAWKLLLLAFDLGTCWLLLRLLERLGRPRIAVLLYAWNPLVVKEIAGSAHVDAVAVFLLTAAVYLAVVGRERLSLAALAGGALVKLGPAVAAGALLPRCRPRSWWVLAAVGLGAYLPFAGSLGPMLEGLGAFAREWQFNAGVAHAVGVVADALRPGAGAAAARVVWLGATLGVVLWGARRRDRLGVAAHTFAVVAVFLLFAPTVMPWYLLWPLPLAVAVGSVAWPLATGLAGLSYWIYAEGRELGWLLALEHLPVLWLLGRELRRLGAGPDLQ
ncbi:MAG TPA: hypothetical protein VF017_23370 [Thermoanaerobaculia bacterium]|nr:hypothetical protein [Thermoanaerobaculia bacterium]